MSSRYRKENTEGGHLRLSAKRKRRRGEGLAIWRKKFTEMKLTHQSELACVGKSIHPNTPEIMNENLKSECDARNTPKNVVSGTHNSEVLGRRIVDIHYFISKLQELNNHSPFGCGLSEMKIISERRRGLVSDIKMKCTICNYTKVVCTENSESIEMNCNAAAVAGIMKIGCGFSNIEDFLSTLNIPPMSINTFIKEQKHISEAWETTAMREMEMAAYEEKMLAIQRGDLDEEGVPLVTAVVDGSWAKRSNKTNHASLSGVTVLGSSQDSESNSSELGPSNDDISHIAFSGGLSPKEEPELSISDTYIVPTSHDDSVVTRRPAAKKSKVEFQESNTAAISNQRPLNEFSVFGQHVAIQLSQLPLEEALVLQEEIQALITRTRLRVIQSSSSSSSAASTPVLFGSYSLQPSSSNTVSSSSYAPRPSSSNSVSSNSYTVGPSSSNTVSSELYVPQLSLEVLNTDTAPCLLVPKVEVDSS